MVLELGLVVAPRAPHALVDLAHAAQPLLELVQQRVEHAAREARQQLALLGRARRARRGRLRQPQHGRAAVGQPPQVQEERVDLRADAELLEAGRLDRVDVEPLDAVHLGVDGGERQHQGLPHARVPQHRLREPAAHVARPAARAEHPVVAPAGGGGHDQVVQQVDELGEDDGRADEAGALAQGGAALAQQQGDALDERAERLQRELLRLHARHPREPVGHVVEHEGGHRLEGALRVRRRQRGELREPRHLQPHQVERELQRRRHEQVRGVARLHAVERVVLDVAAHLLHLQLVHAHLEGHVVRRRHERHVHRVLRQEEGLRHEAPRRL